MKQRKEHWVVVLDDSNCTVGIGGEGYLQMATGECPWDNNCYLLEGACTPYSKSIFRDATKEEVDNWLKNKIRADVPSIEGPRLYEYYFGG